MFENQIVINDRLIEIKQIKMKYIRNDFSAYYSLVLKCIEDDKYDSSNFIFAMNKFLEAIFDKNSEIISYVIDNLNYETIKKLTEKTKVINKLEDKKHNKSKENDKESNDDNDEQEEIDFDRGYSLLGVWCGLSEPILDECSLNTYRNYLSELGVKIQFDGYSNLMSLGGEGIQDLFKEIHPCYVNITGKEIKRKKNTLKDLEKIGIKIPVNIQQKKEVEDIPIISDLINNIYD